MNIDPAPGSGEPAYQGTGSSPRASAAYQPPKEFKRLIEVASEVLKTVPGAKSPIVLFDLDAITEQVALWRKELGGVDPHFAVKCCNHPAVLSHLNSLGVSFDAATAGEIEILERIGVDPKKVICTHPIRDTEDLVAIARYRPRALVVESGAELRKLQATGIPSKDYSPEIFLRIELPFGGLSGKFGAEVTYVREGEAGETKYQILTTPAEVVFKEAQAIERETGAKYGGFGFSSHVGTNTLDTEKYQVELKVFSHLRTKLAERGVEISTFNLGGGYPNKEFPESKKTTQEAVVSKLGSFLTEFQAAHPGVNFIAEPGRFLVSNAGAVVIGVMDANRREYLPQENGTLKRVPNLKVQMNDGLYGNLLGERHDDRSWKFVPFRLDGSALSAETIAAILNGKTCDSWDQVRRLRTVPKDLRAGDLLIVNNAGDYTVVTSTEFNSVSRSLVCTYASKGEGREYKLYDAKGTEVQAGTPALSQATLPSFPKHLMPSLSIMGGLSVVPTLSRVAGSAAGELDSSLLHPGQLLGEAGWERVLTLMAKNDVTLQVNNVLPIAEGGMGWVMKVTEEGLDRPVALKVGKVQATGDLGERFRAEAAKTAELKDDKRIPIIHRFGILPEGNHPYYVMEYVEGETLEALLPGVHLSEERVDWRKGERGALLSHLMNAAEALQYAHDKGVIHRDIKPQNLMVPNDRTLPIKVLDWGLLKAGVEEETLKGDVGAYGQTRMGAVLGTVDYMSPEQARGEEVTEATDIWALGATLYKICTNRLPLEHHGDEEQRLNALRSERDPVRDPSGVPDELKAIILKALSVDPGDRYGTAAEFAEDLENYLGHRVVGAHAEGMSLLGGIQYSARCFVERHPRLVAGSVLSAVGLAGTLFKVNQWKDEQNQREAQALVALTELVNTKERGIRALEQARKAAEDKDLQGAIDKLSEDLILRIETEVTSNPDDTELQTLHDEILAHKADWATLKEFKDKIFSGFSESVNTVDFGKFPEINMNRMREASRIYLPTGLSIEGLAQLELSFSQSKLTPDEMLIVGDGLITVSILDLAERIPKIFREKESIAEEEADQALAGLQMIERLAEICENVGKGQSKAWSQVIQVLYRKYYSSIGDPESEARTYAIAADVSKLRAASPFVSGIFELESFVNPSSVTRVGMLSFTEAISLDKDHLGAKNFLAEIRYRHAEQADTDDERSERLSRLIDALEDCRRQDETNPYLAARLAIACYKTWQVERMLEISERNSGSLPGQCSRAALDAIRLFEERGLTTPAEVWEAYGELSLATRLFSEASEAFSHVLNLRGNEPQIFARFASAEVGKGTILRPEDVLAKLEDARRAEDPTYWTLLEVAVVYTNFAKRAKEDSLDQKSSEFAKIAIDCLQDAASKVPYYKNVITVRAKRDDYAWLKEHFPDQFNRLLQ